MVKKLIDLINIAPVLNILTGKHYKNFKVALEIAELKKEISSKVEFYMIQEKDIADTYAKRFDDPTTKLSKLRSLFKLVSQTSLACSISLTTSVKASTFSASVM